jgi:hypothetical protein
VQQDTVVQEEEASCQKRIIAAAESQERFLNGRTSTSIDDTDASNFFTAPCLLNALLGLALL